MTGIIHPLSTAVLYYNLLKYLESTFINRFIAASRNFLKRSDRDIQGSGTHLIVSHVTANF